MSAIKWKGWYVPCNCCGCGSGGSSSGGGGGGTISPGPTPNDGKTEFFYKSDTEPRIGVTTADQPYDNQIVIPGPNDGQLTFLDHEGNELGVFTADQDGDTEITLPQGFSGDYNDLINAPEINNGKFVIKDSDGNVLGEFTANQKGDTELTLPEGFSGDYDDLINKPDINNGKLTIKDDDDAVLGEFTANQEGDTEVVLPALDCGDVADCISNAPIDPAQLAIAVWVHEHYFEDSSDQPENWPGNDAVDPYSRREFYLFADVCDPDTHELIPFDQEGHGHSAPSGSILKLPHAIYANSHCVITPPPPISRLEDDKELYLLHPESLNIPELKLFRGRYEEGTTTNDDLWNTGTEVVDPTADRWHVKLDLPKCDSYIESPKDGSYWCDEDNLQIDGKCFFRFEFKWKAMDTFKLVLLMNHYRPRYWGDGGGVHRSHGDPKMPLIKIKPMEDN